MKTSIVYLVTSGDLRDSANRICWPAQRDLEAALTNCLSKRGVTLKRAVPVDEARGHGFVSSQREGMDIFLQIPPEAPLIFATAAWQYTHHVLPGLRSHKGSILTVANWSGQWPGLVGLLNLNGSLVKAGVPFSSLWSEKFDDEFFLRGLDEWLATGEITHDLSQVRSFDPAGVQLEVKKVAQTLADDVLRRKAILGVFDEGCMGMYNAILDDELLNPMGLYKERLSQSALLAAMQHVSQKEADGVYAWLRNAGVTFHFGDDAAQHLTPEQVLNQCRMYIAAVRIADEFHCDAIGIQYQQGLKDMASASDLPEGLLNNPERPPVYSPDGRELYAGKALPHFNEVDECAGVDALLTNRVWERLGLDPSTTLHDLRWGELYPRNSAIPEDFVWLLQISGAAPASHFVGGYSGASSMRQPAMYFPQGGGSLRGVSRPGEIVWSRVFQEGGRLHMDIGRGSILELPDAETQRRWNNVTYEWPIVHAKLHGMTRDRLMARHRANHMNIAYAPTAQEADHALACKAALFEQLGGKVHLCGRVQL
ncbi:fucose isomerase [Terriglobus aquaticus]|uniref:Fucose isomerase n=1 Tax=Terriglobus aquaticus TaxID=940139 RepID=A0ABW9KLF7_9BACT|nr:fucose isomerase [Terriglobus aquaticus]